MILDQLEKVFMVIGDKVIMASGGQKSFDNYDIREDNVTSELIIKPRTYAPNAILETRRSLNDITKQAICDLSVERYGVELNFRTEKKVLITSFLSLQDEDNQENK